MASCYKRGAVYYLSWNENGKRHRKSLGKVDRATAKAAVTTKNLALLRNPLGVTPAPTLMEFSTRYLQWYGAQYPSSMPKVEPIVRVHLLPQFGSMPLNLIKRAAVLDWRNQRVAKSKPATINTWLSTLKAMLSRAVDWEVIDDNPLAQRRGSKDPLELQERGDELPHWYQTDELAAIYNASSPRNAALWKLLANTGLRRQELLNLRWADVQTDRMVVLSTEESPTKGRRSRVVPLNPSALEALATLRGLEEDDRYVLRRMTPRSLSRCFERNAAKAGVAGSIHSLRHTFISHAVQAGVPLAAVQQLAGHQNFKTTLRYAHLAPGFLSDTVSRIAL